MARSPARIELTTEEEATLAAARDIGAAPGGEGEGDSAVARGFDGGKDRGAFGHKAGARISRNASSTIARIDRNG